MELNNSLEYFRPYPDYEDVFYDEIEKHKQFFLPICSFNLKCFFPERDEWVHIISAKENMLGVYTSNHHTDYTKESVYGFDIIDGKYKFEASWDYFLLNHEHEKLNQRKIIEEFEQSIDLFMFRYTENILEIKEWLQQKNIQDKHLEDDLKLILNHTDRKESYLKDGHKVTDSYSKERYAEFAEHEQFRIDYVKRRYEQSYFDDLKAEYQRVTELYELGKKFYQEHGVIFPHGLSFIEGGYEELIKEFQSYTEARQKYPDMKSDTPEFFGFISDIKGLSKEAREQYPDGFSNQHIVPIHYNIWDSPFKKKVTSKLEYLACIKEYLFKYHGATLLNVLQHCTAKKAIMLRDFD